MPRAMPKFTKTPPAVVAAFDAASPSRDDVERRTMFGYPALFSRARPGTKRFEPMPGRPMGEYVEVPARHMNGAALRRWMAEGLAYADTLAVKARKTPAVKKKPAART